MQIEKVGVLGCGLMGSGIAHVSAAAGFDTVVREVDDNLLQKGMGRLFGFIDKSIGRGKMSEFEKRQVSTHLRGTTDLKELKDCDLIIEASRKTWTPRTSSGRNWIPSARSKPSSPPIPRR